MVKLENDANKQDVNVNIGLLGGTFDPLHWGHLCMAQKSLQQCALDKVIFIPCRQSPHKDKPAVASGELRFEVVRQVTKINKYWECSDWEIKQKDPAYSIDTIRAFKEQYSDSRLFWIMGSDQWNNFDQWKDHLDIVSLVQLIICRRLGDVDSVGREGFLQEYIHWVDDVNQDISSRDLRQKLKKGILIKDKVPAKVMEWIEENELYGYRGIARQVCSNSKRHEG